jgi:hypothetical protein
MRRFRFELLAALLSFACGGPELRGARVLHASETPRETPIARYTPADCTNARGERVPAPALTVERFALVRGREMLVETRAGYDSIAVTNARAQGPDWVFEFITDDGSGPGILHELRVARAPGARGRLRASDDFVGELADSRAPPLAKTVVLDCALVPGRVGARLDTTRALE